MSQPTKNALVPVKPKSLVPRLGSSRYELVSDRQPSSRARMRGTPARNSRQGAGTYLIDREFADMFARDLRERWKEGHHPSRNMAIEFQKPGTDRPGWLFMKSARTRICQGLYLQLVMMAVRD